MKLDTSRAIAAAVGVVVLALGIWAFAAPRSFFDQLATYPPYNVHLIHDVGAFQIGIGLALVLTFWWRDALLVVLTASGVGFVFHTVSHVIDADLGGRATDPPAIGLMAVAVLVAAVLRARALRS